MRNSSFFILRTLLLAMVFAAGTATLRAQEEESFPEIEEKQTWVERTGARAAFVADAGLAVVRKNPSATGDLKTRLRVGRRVYVLGSKRGDGRTFFFVAVTRRTRGWVDARALVRGRTRGDDDRLFRLLTVETGGFERLRLCRMFAELFPSSKLLPKVLLETGQTAESEAERVFKRAERRVTARLEAGNADAAGYFDNDPALDRYNRLGVKFQFSPADGKYRYDGAAYRRLLAKFPKSPEAATARERLAH
jgi:hypothetical protein